MTLFCCHFLRFFAHTQNSSVLLSEIQALCLLLWDMVSICHCCLPHCCSSLVPLAVDIPFPVSQATQEPLCSPRAQQWRGRPFLVAPALHYSATQSLVFPLGILFPCSLRYRSSKEAGLLFCLSACSVLRSCLSKYPCMWMKRWKQI